MADAYDVIAEKGILEWDDYPRGYMGTKQYRCSDPGFKKNRFYCNESHEEDMIDNDRMKEIIAKQPAGVAIHSNFGCLQHYKKGIVTEHDCKCSDPDKNGDVNHAVTVIGYGKSDQSNCNGDYWIIKNSWGPYWGD